MITLQKEKFEDIMLELPEMLLRHYDEAMPAGAAPPNFNWRKYIALEHAGLYHVMTLRDEGKLVGYGLCLLIESLQDQKLWGYCDAYVRPGDKAGWELAKLCRGIDEMLKSMGTFGNHFANHPQKDISVIYKRLGYNLLEEVFFKVY